MLSEDRKKELLFPHDKVRKFQEDLILDVEKTIKEKNKLLADAPTGLGKTASALGPVLNHALKNNLAVWFLTNRHTQHSLAIDTLKEIQKKFDIKFSCVDLIGKKWMCNQEVKELFSTEFNEFCKNITEKNECEFLNNVKTKNKLTIKAKALIEKLGKKGVLHNEEIIELCNSENFCSYEISFELGKNAKVIVGDYYYIFNPFIQKKILKRLDQELDKIILIVDEAHNLPTRVIEMLSSTLTSNMLRNAILEAKKFGYWDSLHLLEKIESVLKELNEYPESNQQFRSNEKIITKDEFVKKIEKIKKYDEIIDELEITADEIRKKRKKSYIGGIVGFLEAWLGTDDGFTRIIAEKESRFGKYIGLSYYCLDPSLVTKDIFDGVHSAVLMSGTLKPTFMYNDILGIKGKEKEYPNPFPIDNKLTLIVPETTTKYSSRGEKMYGIIAEKCSEMLKLIPGNCAIFFPSYQLRDSIGRKIECDKKKFWEQSDSSKENKELFLEDFKEEKDSGGVLLGVMGGNFGEGVDLPGDLLKGVIVVGVPLGKPDLKTKEVVKYFDEKFGKGWDYGYLYPAMNKCFQSSGRCIRSEEDKGVVIYLDERFSWSNYFCCFPREGVIVSKDYKRFLEEFFGSNI